MNKYIHRATVTPFWLIAMLSSPICAQQQIWHVDGQSKGDYFGQVATGDDVDGDGLPELLIGAQLAISGDGSIGTIGVFSLNGGELARWGDSEVHGDVKTLVADVNGDGVRDCAIGDAAWRNPSLGGYDGRVLVLSVPDGAVLLEVDSTLLDMQLGTSIDRVDDFDGDGLDDIIVGAPGYNVGAGLVYVLSSKTGAILRTYVGSSSYRLGETVAGIADIDGDGVRDYAISAVLDLAHNNEKGRIYVYSGAASVKLYEWTGEYTADRFGTVVLDASDWNGDGVPDVLCSGQIGSTGAGHIDIRSGANGKRIARLDYPDRFEGFGNSASVVPDQNRDGVPELLAGALFDSEGGYNAGSATLYSGRTLRPLYKFLPGYTKAWFGGVIGSARDWNGDGILDFAIGATGPRDAPPKGGRVTVLAGNDLYLQASDTDVGPNDLITLDVRGGTPDALVILAVTDISGTPVFWELVDTIFDANGEASWADVAGDPAIGYDFTLMAYALRDAGRSPIIDSSPVVISVR